MTIPDEKVNYKQSWNHPDSLTLTGLLRNGRTHLILLFPRQTGASEKLRAKPGSRSWNVIDDLPLLIGHNTGLSLVNDIMSRLSLMQIILEEAPGTQEVASASDVDSYPAITADFVSEPQPPLSHYHNHIEFWQSSSDKLEVITLL